MRKENILLLFVLLLLYSCEPNDVRFGDLIDKIIMPENMELKADGASNIEIEVRYNKNAIASDIKAKAIVNKLFMSHEDFDKDELSLVPEVFADGRLRSKFNLVTTTRAGKFNFEIDINDYKRIYSFESSVSIPKSIILSKSSNSVLSGYIGEVTLEGLLLNESQGKVSQGVNVKFRDILDDGSSAGGIFRSESLSSNKDSKVSIIYSPGIMTTDQFVTIIAEIVDNDGNPTGIENSIKVFAYSD